MRDYLKLAEQARGRYQQRLWVLVNARIQEGLKQLPRRYKVRILSGQGWGVFVHVNGRALKYLHTPEWSDRRDRAVSPRLRPLVAALQDAETMTDQQAELYLDRYDY